MKRVWFFKANCLRNEQGGVILESAIKLSSIALTLALVIHSDVRPAVEQSFRTAAYCAHDSNQCVEQLTLLDRRRGPGSTSDPVNNVPSLNEEPGGGSDPASNPPSGDPSANPDGGTPGYEPSTSNPPGPGSRTPGGNNEEVTAPPPGSWGDSGGTESGPMDDPQVRSDGGSSEPIGDGNGHGIDEVLPGTGSIEDPHDPSDGTTNVGSTTEPSGLEGGVPGQTDGEVYF
ncbi:MAG: hypothetical protein KDD66_06290 [Bdellovibrionales bacterium]|nr:hypothetical protein [Bdellovibrionales bacterium]